MAYEVVVEPLDQLDDTLGTISVRRYRAQNWKGATIVSPRSCDLP
jgi:hypothetical protein